MKKDDHKLGITYRMVVSFAGCNKSKSGAMAV